MRRNIKGLLAVLATILGGLLPLAIIMPPAEAAGWGCPANRFCAYTGPNGTGAMATFTTGDGDLSDGVGPQGMNNNIESVWNNRASNWCLYDGAGYVNGIAYDTYGAYGWNLGSSTNRTTSLKACA